MTLQEVTTYFQFFQKFCRTHQNRMPYCCFKDVSHKDFSVIEQDGVFYTVCNTCNDKAKLSNTTIALMEELYKDET